MKALYDLVYGTYNNGGGTQLYNALVRGGIDSLEKFDYADIDYLNTIKGIGGWSFLCCLMSLSFRSY